MRERNVLLGDFSLVTYLSKFGAGVGFEPTTIFFKMGIMQTSAPKRGLWISSLIPLPLPCRGGGTSFYWKRILQDSICEKTICNTVFAVL